MTEDTTTVGQNPATVKSKFPGELGAQFIAVPSALFEHREALGLEPLDVVIVIALERHRRERGAEVFPSLVTLETATGLSERTLRDRLQRLDQNHLGLVPSRQRRRSSKTYDLEPLWQRLASLTKTGRTCRSTNQDRQQMPSRPAALAVKTGSSRRQDRQQMPPNKRKEVEAQKEDEGGKPPAPAPESYSESLRRKAADPDTFPSKALLLLAEAEKAEKRERSSTPEDLEKLAEELERLERLAEHGLESHVVGRLRNEEPLTNRDRLAIRAAEARARKAEPEIINAEATEVVG